MANAEFYEEPKFHTDYYGIKLQKDDIVTHFLDGKSYRITKMLRTNDALVEPLDGMSRRSFNKCPCECLIRKREEVVNGCIQEQEEEIVSA